MEHLIPDQTPSAKFGYGWRRGAELPKPRCYEDFGFIPFISAFFDRAIDRTAEPKFMADGSNDVFSRKEVLYASH